MEFQIPDLRQALTQGEAMGSAEHFGGLWLCLHFKLIHL